MRAQLSTQACGKRHPAPRLHNRRDGAEDPRAAVRHPRAGGGPSGPPDAPRGLPGGCPLGHRARLASAGWCRPARGCPSGCRTAVGPCGGLQPTALFPWPGRAAHAAPACTRCARRRPTPHPAPAHATTCTQHASRPPAAIPPASAARSIALSRPRPPVRPHPRCAPTATARAPGRRRGAAWRARTCRGAAARPGRPNPRLHRRPWRHGPPLGLACAPLRRYCVTK